MLGTISPKNIATNEVMLVKMWQKIDIILQKFLSKLN